MSSELAPGAVELRGLTKQFPGPTRRSRWRQAIPGPVGVPEPHGTVALDEIDLVLEPGRALGIIGANGAGKSTLLKLVAGVLAPTSGTVAHGGRVGSMIELGIGFHPELTGRENLIVGATVLGLTASEAAEREGDITAFADLADAMDTPLKRYSTGMVARLGFALATHVDADVLAIDEVLAVGDRAFQEQCLDHVAELVSQGTTLLFVSHEMSLVDLTCEEVLLLDGGRQADRGPSSEVIEAYLGRPPRRLTTTDPAAMIRTVDLPQQRLAAGSPLVIDTTVEVVRPTEPCSLVTGLSMPALLPGIAIAEHSSVPDIPWDRPGRYHLRGESNPLPWTGGSLRMELMLTEGLRSALSVAEAPFDIAGSTRVVKPMYLLRPTVEITPAQAPAIDLRTSRRGEADESPVLRARGVTKRFSTGRHRTNVRSAVPGRWGGAPTGDLVALDGVDMTIRAGESVGLIGPNGAGKSTLLRAFGGLLDPDAGSIELRGTSIAILELGVGFHGDLTGAENLELSGLLYGLSPTEVAERVEEIVLFSGLGDAVDIPVKHYSTGMKARLGFALATAVPADLLLIDELLAVGDHDFRTLAIDRVKQRQAEGAAVVFVSHNLGLVADTCDRVVRLEQGRLVDDGETEEVIERYGGTGWSAGPAIGTAPIRLHDMAVDGGQHVTGDDLAFGCLVEVAEPCPHARLELSFRHAGFDDRSRELTREELETATVGLAVVAEAGRVGPPGWYRVEGRTGPVQGYGRFDVVLAAVDDRDGDILTEVFSTVRVRSPDGRPRPTEIGIEFSVTWSSGADTEPPSELAP